MVWFFLVEIEGVLGRVEGSLFIGVVWIRLLFFILRCSSFCFFIGF